MMFPLPETITVWRAVGNDGFGGITWSAPSLLPARIAHKQELFTDINGDQSISKAVVYTDGDLAIGDKVHFGESSSLSPTSTSNDIRAIASTPSAINLVKGWL
jgi:hypothetical protein